MTGGILALDLATTTGWAHANLEAVRQWPDLGLGHGYPTDNVEYGTIELGGTASHGRRGIMLHDYLSDLVVRFGPRCLAYEAPIPPQDKGNTNSKTVQLLNGYCFVSEMVAEATGRPCYKENVGTVRKFFCGSGRSQKPDVMHACRVRGWDPDNPDEGDALALLDFTVTRLGKSLLRPAA